MKATLDREEFVKSLNRLSHVVGTRVTLPVLTMALASVRGSALSLTATDLDVSISARLAAKDASYGQVLLPIQKARAVASKMLGETIIIESGKSQASLKCGAQRCSLSTLPVVEFPPEAEIKGAKLLLKQEDLARSLSAVSHAICDDDSRYVFCGVNMVFSSSGLVCAATNGRALATISMPGDFEKLEMIVPSKSVALVQQSLNGSGDVIVVGDGRHAQFDIAGDLSVVIDTKLVEGNFPNYKQVIPEGGSRIEVKIKDWLQAISVCVPMQNELSYGVSVKISSGVATFKSESPSGEAETSLSVEGDKIEFRIDASYLSEALKAFNSETAELWFIDSLSVLRLTCENQLAVIVPLRLV
jgi:DNA polymerase III subunit beta